MIFYCPLGMETGRSIRQDCRDIRSKIGIGCVGHGDSTCDGNKLLFGVNCQSYSSLVIVLDRKLGLQVMIGILFREQRDSELEGMAKLEKCLIIEEERPQPIVWKEACN